MEIKSWSRAFPCVKPWKLVLTKRYRYGAVSLIIALAAAGIVVLLGKL